MNIDSEGTIIVHSSMKSIGEVDGGADTVLEAFCEFMREGLLIFPTHTWAHINVEQAKFYVEQTLTNNGILTKLISNHPNVTRSLHPTKSIPALEERAEECVAGDEQRETPIAARAS